MYGNDYACVLHNCPLDLSGGHEQPLEGQHGPKPLGATGGEGGMSQRNPSDQTVTDNTVKTLFPGMLLTICDY